MDKAFARFERAMDGFADDLTSEELTRLRQIITERSPTWPAVLDSLLALSAALETPPPEMDGLIRTISKGVS